MRETDWNLNSLPGAFNADPAFDPGQTVTLAKFASLACMPHRWTPYGERCRHIESRLTGDGDKLIRCTHCNIERKTAIGDFESRINFAENHTDCRHDAPFGEGLTTV